MVFCLDIVAFNQPDISAMIIHTLAKHQVNVLDIEQAVVNKQVSLGLLISLPETIGQQQLRAHLQTLVGQHEDRVQFKLVDRKSYCNNKDQLRKAKRYIVTLLARQLGSGNIASLMAIATEHGFSFHGITRLTDSNPSNSFLRQVKISIEFSVRGVSENIAPLRSAFMELSHRLNIDIAVQEESVFRRQRRLICFDMDSTLIQAEVIDELAVEAGVGDKVKAITERAMTGELDFDQSFTERMSLLAGLDERVLSKVADRLKLMEGAERLFTVLNQLGYKTAILSGGFDYFARILQKKLNIDYVFANNLQIEDGKVTGKVSGPIINGQRKAALLRELADRENIRLEQVVAVGDGANDLPMLGIAGLGIAFRAKPLVRASARQSLSHLGLDAILYLMGLNDHDISSLNRSKHRAI